MLWTFWERLVNTIFRTLELKTRIFRFKNPKPGIVGFSDSIIYNLRPVTIRIFQHVTFSDRVLGVTYVI